MTNLNHPANPIRKDPRTVATATRKAKVITMIGEGYTTKQAMDSLGMHVKTYEAWRNKDTDFKAAVDRVRAIRGGVDLPEREELQFAAFSERYLGARVFPHMLNVVDLLEGREPQWLPAGLTYERGETDLVLVNMPPEHPVAFSTPVLTASRGWVTMGEITEDDWIYSKDGRPAPIAEVWTSPEPVPVYDVVFDSGDVIRTSAEHLWNAYPVRAGTKARARAEQVPTARLFAQPGEWRIPVAAPVFPYRDADLPLDPYLFGYWLGDGCHSKSEFAVGFEDIDAFRAQLDGLGVTCTQRMDSRGRSWVVYVHGIRKSLRETGEFCNIDRGIPDAYLRGSFSQRLALLQGLMDADGTITAKDSRARFVQHKERLSRDVYRLVASLGLKPHFKKYGDAYEVGFRSGNDPVFRLARKAARQRPLSGTSKASHRVVTAVHPAGMETVRCISVVTDTNEYLIGDGCIPTRNGKSTTITMNYVAYRIAMDPNIRVIIVSKTQAMAKKFLFGVKERLTHRQYADMIAAYGPPGGFDRGSSSWTQDMIYISPDVRDAGEKDPTVQALGIRGHIYGARADLIILDDCVDHTNAHEFDKQIDWIQGQVLSRISDAGALLVVGTRLAARDLYAELRKPDYYPEGDSPWTYLSMPAVLEFADDPAKWVTLWPRSNMAVIGGKGDNATADENGLYPKWDGPRLAKKRARMTPENWARIYQQQQTAEDQIFHPEAVRAVTNFARVPGLMPKKGIPGTRQEGMDGLIVVAGLDPASPSGFVGAIVIGLDPQTQKRYVLDVWNKTKMAPDDIRNLIKGWTDKYNIVEWRIEKNAFQTMLTQDREINEFLAARSCILREHQTNSNKWNVDFGVASMSTLFANHDTGHALIELPSSGQSEMAKALVEQLTTWAPDAPKYQRTDVVMALWFTELACRDRVASMAHYGRHHINNPYATAYDLSQRVVVDIREFEQQRAYR